MCIRDRLHNGNDLIGGYLGHIFQDKRSFTISIWVKPDDSGSNNDGYFFVGRNNGISHKNCLHFGKNDKGQLMVDYLHQSRTRIQDSYFFQRLNTSR